jgi:hypothetical protein
MGFLERGQDGHMNSRSLGSQVEQMRVPIKCGGSHGYSQSVKYVYRVETALKVALQA